MSLFIAQYRYKNDVEVRRHPLCADCVIAIKNEVIFIPDYTTPWSKENSGGLSHCQRCGSDGKGHECLISWINNVSIS